MLLVFKFIWFLVRSFHVLWNKLCCCVKVYVYVVRYQFVFLSICHIEIVLKRCISGLPQTECPFIPKKTLLLARSRYSRSIVHNQTDYSHDIVERSTIRFPDELTPQSQKAVVEEPCEERRILGSEILIEKGKFIDSMLSRFVGNFIMIFSNHTSSQEVSARCD